MKKDEIEVPHSEARRTFQGTPCFAQEGLAYDCGYREGYFDAMNKAGKNFVQPDVIKSVCPHCGSDKLYIGKRMNWCDECEKMIRQTVL